VNSTIDELNLPHEVIVGAIIHDEEVIIPKGDYTVRAGDVVVVLASRAQAQNVEKMFSVHVDIF